MKAGVKAAVKAANEGPAEMSFEEAFSALEAAVSKLEAGSLNLEESVALYEEGLRLAKLCGLRLDSAELRITRLSAGAGGESVQVPFEEKL